MLLYLIKRLLLAILTLFAILLVSYTLLRLAPGDPTRAAIFGEGGNAGVASAERGVNPHNAALRQKLHLDEPILTGFASWLGPVLKAGDFGTSATVEPGRSVTAMIAERLPVTVSLNLLALLLTMLIAIPIGIGGAVRPDRWFDRLTTAGVFLLYSLPVMWVGLLLQAGFCEGGRWPLFPVKGIAPYDPEQSTWGALLTMLKYYFLPVLCLAYGGLAGLSRYTRSSMLEVFRQDYIRTARAKGLPESTVVLHHAFRNSLIPLITLFSGMIPGLVAGSIIVEHIFNLPGMGSLSLLALSSRDYPLEMALFAFTGALTLAGILLADLLYMAADPRINLAGK